MAYTNPVFGTPLLIPNTHPLMLRDMCAAQRAGVGASAVYPSANRAFYMPLYIPSTMTLTKMFWLNGAAVSGNVDMGVYDAAGTRLVSSGSTAQSGTSAVQVVDVTDTALTRGCYYLAIACDNTTATFIRVAPSIVLLRGLGCVMQDTAFALPATATFAAYASAYFPYCGASFRAITGTP